jgi:hypothetical protein
MLGSAQEMMDALQEIAESALDPAQKEALMKQTQEFYNERYRYMSEEYEKTISSNKELYDKDLKLMEEYKHDKITIGNGLVTEFSSSILGKLTGSLTASDFSATITNAFGTAVTAVGQAMDDYSVNISAIMEKAGVTGEDGFAKKIEEEISGDNGIIA